MNRNEEIDTLKADMPRLREKVADSALAGVPAEQVAGIHKLVVAGLSGDQAAVLRALDECREDVRRLYRSGRDRAPRRRGEPATSWERDPDASPRWNGRRRIDGEDLGRAFDTMF